MSRYPVSNAMILGFVATVVIIAIVVYVWGG